MSSRKVEECKAVACGEMVDTNYPVEQHVPQTLGLTSPEQPAAAAAAEVGRCRCTLWNTR